MVSPAALTDACPHHDPVLVELHLLDAQSEQFVDPHAGSVEQIGQKLLATGKVVDHGLDLRPAGDHGETHPHAGAGEVAEIAKILFDHLSVEEDHGIERLILR